MIRGEIKYLPPVSKEWKSTIYSYYKNEIKNSPINLNNINKIIKSYFNIYFNKKFLFSMVNWKRRSLIKRIFASKVELKNTNSIVIITSYIFNVKKTNLYKKYIKLYIYIQFKILAYWKFKLKKKIIKLKKNITRLIKLKNKKKFFYSKLLKKHIKNKEIYSKLAVKKRLNIFSYKYLILTEEILLYLNYNLTKAAKYSYINKLKVLRKYELDYNINQVKFVRNNFLFILANILFKILKKKIIFNLVKLKSITYNTDIFTSALTLKLRKRNKFNVLRGMKSILGRASIPRLNTIIERGKDRKKKFSYLTSYGYKENDYSLTSIIKNFSLNKLLNKINFIDNTTIYKNIFNKIKYKSLGGIRLEVKGRLTKRYRADRSVYKLRWKGGLKNIDSSFKGLSTVFYRGYLKPNLAYSLSKSKRRIGSFAVKGWISGK